MATDEEEVLLVLLVQRSDLAAFERLLLRLHRPMSRYLVSLVGTSLAEDVLQETSLKIYQKIKFLREPKAFQAWAYRIATRLAFVHLKREKRWMQTKADIAAESAVAPSPPKQDEFESQSLGRIDLVSPASRAVLLLHYQQHRSLEETAAILDIPLGTAKSRLSYGVAQLRALMNGREEKEKEKEKR